MTPEELRTEAKRLYDLQVSERGTEAGPTLPIDGKQVKTKIPGSYVPTPEREARAAQIISLRKQAGRAEHRLRGEAT